MIDLKPVLIAATLAAASAPAVAAPSHAQATYDEAQAALDKGDWNAAIAGFSTLVPTDPRARLQRSQAQIASRLAFALLHAGRTDEAGLAARRAADALPPGDDGELSDAWETAADAARFGYAYPEAAAAYAKAAGFAAKAGDKTTLLAARLGSAEALMTIDPKAVATDLDALLQDKALTAGLSKPALAQIVDLRARAALNAGDTTTAARQVERAVDLSGGLTTFDVSTAQVAIRNDAALVYGLRHDEEDTRKYLAYTGAGHLKNPRWVSAFSGDLPVCAEHEDMGLDDVAVVQFAIDEHGEVKGALPIYASRTGEMGEAFARAVSAWRWDPDALKGVEPFWRATLVLQLRCQTRPTPESLDAPVVHALGDWLGARGVASSQDPLAAKVAADDARLNAEGPQAIVPLLARYRHDPTPAMAARITGVLASTQAPPSAYALFYAEDARVRGGHGAPWRRRAAVSAEALAQATATFRQRFPDDPAVAWLLIQQALDFEDAGDFAAAAPVLQQVTQLPEAVLPDGAPIRRVALLHAGLVARRLGREDAAQARIAASGLSPEQCSLFDTHPVAASLAVSSADFPQEAMRWGFEGYVKEGFDITGDGHVVHPRTLVAYPPFVFDKNSEKAASFFRYLPPRIGDKAVGCTGQTQGIAYRIGS